jgi:DNA-binding FrmR family transcriptional regulator
MSHTIGEKETLLELVRRLGGKLGALELVLEQEKGCGEILHLVAAADKAMNDLVAEVIQNYIRLHIVGPSPEQNQMRAKAVRS